MFQDNIQRYSMLCRAWKLTLKHDSVKEWKMYVRTQKTKYTIFISVLACTCYRYCLFRDLQVSLVDTMYLQHLDSLDFRLICIGKNQFQTDGLNILATLWVLRRGPCHQGIPVQPRVSYWIHGSIHVSHLGVKRLKLQERAEKSKISDVRHPGDHPRSECQW